LDINVIEQKCTEFMALKYKASIARCKKILSYIKKFLLINSFYSVEEYFTFDAKFDPDKN
jgi:hypothetical protein